MKGRIHKKVMMEKFKDIFLNEGKKRLLGSKITLHPLKIVYIVISDKYSVKFSSNIQARKINCL